MRKTCTVFFLMLFLLGCSFLAAEEIKFSADSMTGTAGSKTDTTSLAGNAFVSTSSMEIKADMIELSGEDFRYITADGTVSGSITESQMDFTCGKLTYDRKTKIAQLEDSVHLVDNANDVTADAQLIEYDQNNETAVMQIEITLKQKDNVCTSAFAIYRKNEQVLEMSGNPKIVQGKDSFRAQEITLNLSSQEITLDGRVRGTVTDTRPEQSVSTTPDGGDSNQTPVPDENVTELPEETPADAEEEENL